MEFQSEVTYVIKEKEKMNPHLPPKKHWKSLKLLSYLNVQIFLSPSSLFRYSRDFDAILF